jgi:hypothetical protein
MIRPLRRLHSRLALALWWLLPVIAFAAWVRVTS